MGRCRRKIDQKQTRIKEKKTINQQNTAGSIPTRLDRHSTRVWTRLERIWKKKNNSILEVEARRWEIRENVGSPFQSCVHKNESEREKNKCITNKTKAELREKKKLAPTESIAAVLENLAHFHPDVRSLQGRQQMSGRRPLATPTPSAMLLLLLLLLLFVLLLFCGFPPARKRATVPGYTWKEANE